MPSFFFNDTATTEIYTLSLHDALPIFGPVPGGPGPARGGRLRHRGRVVGGALRRHHAHLPQQLGPGRPAGNRPAVRVGGGRGGEVGREWERTRLNSSHANISYAVFFF